MIEGVAGHAQHRHRRRRGGQEKLNALTRELVDAGVAAEGFVGDATDAAALTPALRVATSRLGAIRVLQYSPVPAPKYMRPILETTAADLEAPIAFSVYAPVTAVREVLPGMRSAWGGSILFVNGSSAVCPRAAVGGTSIAFAVESAYSQMLHDALVEENTHVAQLIIPLGIGGGDPAHEPAALDETLWRMQAERVGFRTMVPTPS